MKTIIHTLTLFLLAFAVITPTFADDKADKAKVKKKKPVPAAINVPKSIKLNEDQRAKLAALNKELGPKLAACRKEAAGISPPTKRKPGQPPSRKPRLPARKARNFGKPRKPRSM